MSNNKIWQVSEIARLTTLTGATIRNFIKSGFLKAKKIKHKYLITNDEVKRVFGGLNLDIENEVSTSENRGGEHEQKQF